MTDRPYLEVWPVYTAEVVDDYSSVALVCADQNIAKEIAAELDGGTDTFGTPNGVRAWASRHPMHLYFAGEKSVES